MSENNNEQQRPQSYAERRGGGTRAVQRAREADEARKAEQARIAASIGSKLTPLGDRLRASKASESRIAEERRAQHEAEQQRVAKALEEGRQRVQGDDPLPYSAQLTAFTLPPNNPSTKDLRTPTERRREATERWASRPDEVFAD